MIGPMDIYVGTTIPGGGAGWVSSNNPIETQVGDDLWIEFQIGAGEDPEPQGGTLSPPLMHVVMAVGTGQPHGQPTPGIPAVYNDFGTFPPGAHLIKISPGLGGQVGGPLVINQAAPNVPPAGPLGFGATTHYEISDVPPPWWGFAVTVPMATRTMPDGTQEEIPDPREYMVDARAYCYED